MAAGETISCAWQVKFERRARMKSPANGAFQFLTSQTIEQAASKINVSSLRIFTDDGSQRKGLLEW
jgi:hypothetical protein